MLPADIVRDWRAQLWHTPDTGKFKGCKGEYRLVSIERLKAGGYQELRIIVKVIDETERLLDDVLVAFSYSTAQQFVIDDQFKWTPPQPWRADLVPTMAGRAEHIQGSVVKEGEPGGVTVYVLDQDYASDFVTGMGALADHTGIMLTFQRFNPSFVPLEDRVALLEHQVSALEESSHIHEA